MIAPGRYFGRATGPQDAQWGHSSKGTEQLAIPIELLDENQEATGSQIAWVGSFGSDESTRISLEALQSLGWDGNPGDVTSGVGSKVAEVEVEHHTHNGKTYPRVKWVGAPGAGRFRFKAEMSPQAKKAFQLSLKQRIVAMRQIGGVATPPPAAAKRMREPGEDDLPW